LALGMWQGKPVFGLPGNPVAALVCTVIFAGPALSLMSGAGWTIPQGFTVPAAFTKNKKPGRREYLRARIRNGHAEVFKSEGSGRISGLSWAEGLVELPDQACQITPGTPVTYIPFSSFGF
jgi:molybdopterin molybdotransferase